MLVVQLKIMMLVSLLSYVLFEAFTAQAKVVQNFEECSNFFYKGQEPTGMDQNAIKICQKYGYNVDAFFATLYSSHHRIPVYSAYTYTPGATAQRMPNKWMIEPQISGNYNQETMGPEREFNIDIIKRHQAINKDYEYTGYDRGHLNPKSFQSDDGRVATFTLTNAAPMDACLNRVHWKEWESKLQEKITQSLTDNQADVYLLTGTVPSPSFRIPRQEESDEEDTGNFNRVTVPTHVWTALCYKDKTDNRKSFSLGYIGQNQPDSNIEVMTVQNLNSKLRNLYHSPQVQIFVDDCFSTNERSQTEVRNMYKQIKLLESQRLRIDTDVLNIFQPQLGGEVSAPVKRRKFDSLVVTMSFEDTPSFFKQQEDVKYFTESACLLTKVNVNEDATYGVTKRSLSQKRETLECQQVLDKSKQGSKSATDGTPCMISTSTVNCVCDTEGPFKFVVHDELRKRALGQTSRSVPEEECKIKTTADGKPCQSELHYCETYKGFKPYCTAPCLYQKELKDYYCYSGETKIPCSPQYSLITAEGEKCKDDHPCGTYGYDYYWCEKALGSWDYCSPPLVESVAKNSKKCRTNHACAKYGKSHYWCYTDYNGNSDKCCTHNDTFSAIDGKTCKSDHPCGYHDKRYLWCYTTDGSWDYCCVGA